MIYRFNLRIMQLSETYSVDHVICNMKYAVCNMEHKIGDRKSLKCA